jgi:hypothetical protein
MADVNDAVAADVPDPHLHVVDPIHRPGSPSSRSRRIPQPTLCPVKGMPMVGDNVGPSPLEALTATDGRSAERPSRAGLVCTARSLSRSPPAPVATPQPAHDGLTFVPQPPFRPKACTCGVRRSGIDRKCAVRPGVQALALGRGEDARAGGRRGRWGLPAAGRGAPARVLPTPSALAHAPVLRRGPLATLNQRLPKRLDTRLASDRDLTTKRRLLDLRREGG